MAESESWQFNKSALECHKYMLEHSIATDVTFVVSNKVNDTREDSNCVDRFKAHKYQLICRSPVFHAMLCGGLAEKGEIVVDDIHPDAFRQMLHYIYTDEMDMKPEVAMSVLYASKKYLIPGLQQNCVDYLAKELSSSNACILYDHSLFFDETEISEKVFSLVKNKTEACFESPSMVHIRQTTLSKILDSDRFTIPEIDVFLACEAWARHQVVQAGKEVTGEAIRNVLGDCVTKVRYPAMTVWDFGTMVGPKGILLPDEEISIFRFLASKTKGAPPNDFHFESRFVEAPFTIVYQGNCTTVPSSGYTATFDITCNQNINVKRIIIGELKPGRLMYSGSDVDLNCVDVCLGNTIYKVKSLAGNSSKLIVEGSLTFKNNTKYTLQLELKLNNTVSTVSREPSFQCATSGQIELSDTRTGLRVSVSSNDRIFLLGFVYDFI